MIFHDNVLENGKNLDHKSPMRVIHEGHCKDHKMD